MTIYGVYNGQAVLTQWEETLPNGQVVTNLTLANGAIVSVFEQDER